MASANRYVGVTCGRDGTMDAYLAVPGGTPKGALVVVQEIFGVNAAMRAIADDLAAEGYAALVPDIFWRLEPRLELGNGEPGPDRDKAISLMNRLDVEAGVSDLGAAAHWLRRERAAKVGLVGFCLGGRLAALAADAGAVDSAVAFYGVGLDKYLDRIGQIAIPVQFHFGSEDTQIPPATIAAVEAALAAGAAPRREVFVYPGANHAFFNRHRADRFDPGAHRLARSRMLDFFAATLGAGGPAADGKT